MTEALGAEPMIVVPNVLHELSQSTRAAADELAGAFGSLEPDAVQVADGWAGAAGCEFDAQWDEIRSRSRAVIDGLTSIAADLEDARQGYTGVDDWAAQNTIAVLNLD